MSATNLNNLKKAELIALIETERQNAHATNVAFGEAVDEIHELRRQVSAQQADIEELRERLSSSTRRPATRGGFIAFGAFCETLPRIAAPGQMGACLLDPEHGNIRANVHGVCPKCATAGHAAHVAESRAMKAAA